MLSIVLDRVEDTGVGRSEYRDTWMRINRRNDLRGLGGALLLETAVVDVTGADAGEVVAYSLLESC